MKNIRQYKRIWYWILQRRNMKIVDRIIQIKIKVGIVNKDGKQYTMVKKYVFFYLASLILFVNAGIISVVLMGLPLLFNVSEKCLIFTLVISNLIPILIFGLISKRKKYVQIEKE